MPRKLRAYLDKHSELRRAFFNTNWLLANKILSMVLALVIGVVIIRYLGPEQYGRLGYLRSLLEIFIALSSLGIAQVALREIVNEEHDTRTILGTALLLRALASIIVMPLFLVFLSMVKPGDFELLSFGAVLATARLVVASSILTVWFQAKVRSKHVVIARFGSKILFSLIKLLLVLSGASLGAFVVAIAGEQILAALLIIFLFRVRSRIKFTSLRVKLALGKELLKDSWPLMISVLMMAIATRIDQVMIGQMLTDNDVGGYAAASHITGFLYTLPPLLLVSVFPWLLKMKKTDVNRYHLRFQLIYDALLWSALGIATILWLLSDRLVLWIFGAEYAASADIMAIQIWSIVFHFFGVVTFRYLLAENLTKITLVMAVSGAIANILANFTLIPIWGTVGAAWATLISAAVGYFIAAGIFNKSRITMRFMVQSISPLGLYLRWRPIITSETY